MVISTLWSFDNELYFKVQMKAKELYEEQTGREFFLVVDNEETQIFYMLQGYTKFGQIVSKTMWYI